MRYFTLLPRRADKPPTTGLATRFCIGTLRVAS